MSITNENEHDLEPARSRFLSLKDIVQRESVSHSTVRYWIMHGVRGRFLPAVRRIGKIFVDEAELDDFLNDVTEPVIPKGVSVEEFKCTLTPREQRAAHNKAMKYLMSKRSSKGKLNRKK